MFERPNLLSDALYNVSPGTGGSDDYAHGLVVGAVSALRAVTGRDYKEVIAVIAERLPVTFEPDRLPPAFRGDIVDAYHEIIEAKRRKVALFDDTEHSDG